MAGDWIKMRTDLYRDPKVCLIADELISVDGDLARYVSQNLQRDMAVTRNVMRNVTVGALVTVWGVMRLRGKRVGADLVCQKASIPVIDDMAELPGFGSAMESVGWVIETEEGIVFPRFFDDYNVDPSDKKTSSAADRQRRYRERNKSISDVTQDVTRDVTVTHREEKRREEKKEQKKEQAPAIAPADLFVGVSELVVADFKKLRKAKKAEVTETAVAGIRREAEKAGLTLEAALTMCCERGWASFKADWVADKATTATPTRKRKQLGEGSSTNYGDKP